MPRRLSLLAAVLLAVTACSSSGPGTSATAPAAKGADAAAAKAPANWSTYHYSTYRTANYPSMPAFTKATVAKKLTLDAAVYASPIVIGGVVVVATENNTVYAFDAHYKQLWKRHLGAPARAANLPCGNIDPLGITGTPVYSPTTKSIYLAAEFSDRTHKLYALSLKTGAATFSRSLDLPGVDRNAMQQRGALLALGSRVYVPFGGLAGDCGQYKGRVVSYPLSGKGGALSFTVPTAREAGIWTPPGPVADAAGHILVAVGNGASGVGDRYDYSDSILELSPTLKRTDSFSPSTWPTDNDADYDLGSQGPAIVGNFVFTAGKSGYAYTLRRSALGGIGGQVSRIKLCRSFGGTAVRPGNLVYVPCTDGVRAVRISSTGRMTVLWHASGSVTGSPVYGGGRLWSLDTGAGVLHALSLTKGTSVLSVKVGGVTRFATPAEYGRSLYVPTLTGLTVVRTS